MALIVLGVFQQPQLSLKAYLRYSLRSSSRVEPRGLSVLCSAPLGRACSRGPGLGDGPRGDVVMGTLPC